MRYRRAKPDRDAKQWPLRVALIDADAPVEISAMRSDGPPYVGAWVFVLRDGYPCGNVEVDFDGRGFISAEEVEKLAAAFPAGRPAEPAADLPSISVVISTNLARPDGLIAALESVEATDYPEREIVVVNNSPSDENDALMADVMRRFPAVVPVRERRPGLSAARNAGVREARSDVIAFTDDDVIVDRGWLRALGSRYASRPDEDAVTGIIIPQELETPAQVWFERFYGGFGGPRQYTPLSYAAEVAPDGRPRPWRVTATDSESNVVRSFALYGAGAIGAGANMSFRAAALRRVGGFDPALGPGTPSRSGDDLFAIMSLLWSGGRIGYEPGAMVFHRHREHVVELRHQLFNYGIAFSGVLASLVSHDRRHLWGILRMFPPALRVQAQAMGWLPIDEAKRAHLPRSSKDVPTVLRVLEAAGFFYGPRAYMKSAREAARWEG